ncbi:DUF6233 domain-containing protein [Streptomyces sp. NPDC059861]|uniref:DUF6233 domain-containing protein n=1 Tax=Streptomyces sp. NPDC059861 TaxID=3346974 RepID=UPI003665A0C8
MQRRTGLLGVGEVLHAVHHSIERFFGFVGKQRHGSQEQQVSGQEPLSRLDTLRFVQRVVEQQPVRQLRLIDRWIADEEPCEAARRQGEERRPAPPDRLVQYGLNHTNGRRAHRDCWAAADGGRCRPATWQQALDALRQQVPACVHCRPDTTLGIPA